MHLMLQGNGLLEFLSLLRISYLEFCGSGIFVTKSNTNGEALWFPRAGCSVVCEYHFNFFCIKYYSKEDVKVGNAMISENKTLQSNS